MARTNIDIDEALIRRVMAHYRFSTKREAVEYALRRLDVEPMTGAEIRAMEGSGWEGDLDEMRSGDQPPPSLPRDVRTL